MVILIGGSSHVGKTLLAQKLLEKYHWPYLSLDHLKMGFIRSGRTELTVQDDYEMRYFLWPFVAEMIRTVIEGKQNLIVTKLSKNGNRNQALCVICSVLINLAEHFEKLFLFCLCAVFDYIKYLGSSVIYEEFLRQEVAVLNNVSLNCVLKFRIKRTEAVCKTVCVIADNSVFRLCS